jgi:hypothetical protein
MPTVHENTNIEVAIIRADGGGIRGTDTITQGITKINARNILTGFIFSGLLSGQAKPVFGEQGIGLRAAYEIKEPAGRVLLF